jgi:hypothetical protein
MKLKKKYVVLEVETDLTNRELKSRVLWYFVLDSSPILEETTLIQVQVNTVKPMK